MQFDDFQSDSWFPKPYLSALCSNYMVFHPVLILFSWLGYFTYSMPFLKMLMAFCYKACKKGLFQKFAQRLLNVVWISPVWSPCLTCNRTTGDKWHALWWQKQNMTWTAHLLLLTVCFHHKSDKIHTEDIKDSGACIKGNSGNILNLFIIFHIFGITA